MFVSLSQQIPDNYLELKPKIKSVHLSQGGGIGVLFWVAWGVLDIHIHVLQNYRINRNFSEDLIVALLARFFSSLKLCNANNTIHLDTMCFI